MTKGKKIAKDRISDSNRKQHSRQKWKWKAL